MAEGERYGEIAIERAELEPWENPTPERDYMIEITFPEFSCLCPRSGYPDYATIKIRYIPDKYIVELRSSSSGSTNSEISHISHEEATNEIYSALEQTLRPRFLRS
ncbi:MAG: preQ(1) synthase [Aquificota bacterium]|nr:preQ(1) synthase [Aquificota bacterium]